MNAPYASLKERFHLLSNLSGAAGILYMDSMTAMKPGSESDRSEQTMALATAGQKLLSHPEVKDWLDAAESHASTLSPDDQTNLRLMRRDWVSATALPESLVRERASRSRATTSIPATGITATGRRCSQSTRPPSRSRARLAT